jgi:hypothetical protein
VGNVRKRKGKRLNEKERKRNEQKLRKWGSWEKGTRRVRKSALGFRGENGEDEAYGCLKTNHVAYWTMSIDRSKQNSIDRSKCP